MTAHLNPLSHQKATLSRSLDCLKTFIDPTIVLWYPKAHHIEHTKCSYIPLYIIVLLQEWIFKCCSEIIYNFNLQLQFCCILEPKHLSFQSQTFLGAFGKLRALGTSGPSLSKPHQSSLRYESRSATRCQAQRVGQAFPIVEDALALRR